MSAVPARVLGSAQLALGALLVGRPGVLAGHVPWWIVRLLGARGLVQGAVTVLDPDTTTLGLGACVDAAHALSMLPVVVASSRYRRPAAISGAVAAGLAVAGLGLARRDPASVRAT
jgi:hypothetical protein